MGSLDTRVSTAELDIDTLDGELSSIDTRVTSLEDTIMEDVDMVEESISGLVAAPLAPTVYTLSGVVQDNDPVLVQVFVNGHKVRCTAVAGTQATVVAPYDIDATDIVTFLFQQE